MKSGYALMRDFSSAGLPPNSFHFPPGQKEVSSRGERQGEVGKAMLIYEYKLDGKEPQYQAIDEAIRTVQFVRNKCLRKWMDGRGVCRDDLQCHCAVLAQEY